MGSKPATPIIFLSYINALLSEFFVIDKCSACLAADVSRFGELASELTAVRCIARHSCHASLTASERNRAPHDHWVGIGAPFVKFLRIVSETGLWTINVFRGGLSWSRHPAGVPRWREAPRSTGGQT